MPPKLALLLCILFILYLFRRDIKNNPSTSYAIWIVFFWVLIAGSRPLSLWFNLGFSFHDQDALLEGSPIDRIVFLALIVAGIFTLVRRHVSMALFIQRNPWVFLFLMYGAMSILWSDFPMTAFKRWIKSALGTTIMIMIILTDPRPIDVLKTVIKRTAYVLIPLSIVYIKYFPQMGIAYDQWTGLQMPRGVTWDKNMLGYLCLVCGFFFLWDLRALWRKRDTSTAIRIEVFIYLLFLGMIGWLFKRAGSATALGCFTVGSLVMLGFEMSLFKKKIRYLGRYFLFFGVVITILFLIIPANSLVSPAVDLTGHAKTFWGRVDLWKDLIHTGTNSWVGTGYESFWLGDRLSKLWEVYWWHPNEAHNGYLETYLNLGLIGLFLLAGIAVSALRNSQRRLLHDFNYGRFCIGFLIIALTYNITEASFKGLSLIWLIFLLIAVKYPRPATASFPAMAAAIGSDRARIPNRRTVIATRQSLE
jgi:exopolysaccharide production protein ExoQ